MQLLTKIIENEGIILRRSGRVYMGHCPFHEDKNPSFAVYENSNRFICFGCGEKGDLIDFIRKLRNLTFKEALAYLGINRTDNKKQKNTMGHELLTTFRRWENKYYDELATEFRAINKVIRTLKTTEEMERCDSMFHRLPVIEYQMDLLTLGNDEEKLNLFKEVVQ